LVRFFVYDQPRRRASQRDRALRWRPSRLYERCGSKGGIWAFARSIEEGVLVEDGLTILRAARSKKRVKRGPRTFALRKWEPREGRIDISLRASVGRYSF
jgi:hypothetical protein